MSMLLTNHGDEEEVKAIDPDVGQAPELLADEESEDDKWVFKTSKGLVLRLKRIDPIKLQNAASAVKLPKIPTYSTKSISGRVRTFALDEKSALETEGGLDLWRSYQTELRNAQGEQFNFLTRTVLYYGVEFEPPEDGWDEELEFLGYEIPPSPDMRKVFYLMNEMTIEDLSALILKSMDLTVTSEQLVQESQKSFPGTVRQA